MKNLSKQIVFLAGIAVAAVVPLPALADIPIITSGTLTSTAASGTSFALSLSGQSSCSVVYANTGSATLTVKGSADGTTFVTNTAFGSSGVISSAGTFPGNVASYPQIFEFTWSGNNGTITYNETCSPAFGSVSVTGGSSTNATLVSPLDGSGNVKVATQTGSTTAATQATAANLNATVVQSTGTNLHTNVDNLLSSGQATMANSAPVAIASNQSPVPVSGTVTSSLPYGSGAAQSSTANSFVGVAGFDSTNVQPIKTSTSGVLQIQQCNATGLTCASIVGTAIKVDNSAVTQPANVTQFGGTNLATGTGAGGAGIPRVTVSNDSSVIIEGYNGTNYDPVRKDTYTAGPLWANGGGSTTATVAAGTGTTVIKGSAGRLVRFVITTAGTSGNTTCYDNASTGSGTILAIIDGTTTLAGAVVGYVSPEISFPAFNGITCVGATGSPAFTLSYY